MSELGGDHRQDLLGRIDARRASIDGYLQHARPRGNRLVTTAIVSSAIAAVLTAGPALGGETFASGVADSLSLPNDSIVWRSLCFLALAVSIIAAITTNLSRSQDTANRIAAAEATNAELEGLRTLVEFGQVPVGDAARLYQQYVTKIPWIEERHAMPAAAPDLPSPYGRQGPPVAWGQPPPGWSPPGPRPPPAQDPSLPPRPDRPR